MSRAEDEADEHVSEYGAGVSRMQAIGYEQEDRETARLALSTQVLVEMAEEQAALALEKATRAGEMDAWTDRWEGADTLPPLGDPKVLAGRRARAEAYREESAIHRRRQTALIDGAEALGWKGNDDGG